MTGALAMNVTVCVPTLNARRTWPEFSAALKGQTLFPSSVLVIDSGSDDGTAELAEHDGFQVVRIARHEFNHGRTRQRAVDISGDSNVIVFLTQDAILASPDALAQLLRAFDDPSVGAAYGRQLPHNTAGPIEAHARLFNYPADSAVRSMESASTLGFKTAFFSDSFGAYRTSALASIGGFPLDVNFGEDTVAAARLLLSGWKIAYVAEAQAFHSHNYTFRQEFQRYRDVGQLHASQSWMLESFGAASGEGLRFVMSELLMLFRSSPLLIPSAIIRSACKFLGYKVGRHQAGRPSLHPKASGQVPPMRNSY